MRPDVAKCATTGWGINLARLLLSLCDPFLEPSTNRWQNINVVSVFFPDVCCSSATGCHLRTPASLQAYVVDPERASIDLTEDTKLGSSLEEARDLGRGLLREREQSEGAASPKSGYHFVCECFFLAGKALHLGVKAALEEMRNIQRSLSFQMGDLEEAKALMEQAPPGSPERMRLELQYKRLKAHQDQMQGLVLTYQAMLADDRLMAQAVSYFRLAAFWVMRLARQGEASLPEEPPAAFRILPEFMVEDLCEVVSWVGRTVPHILEGSKMEELVVFLTTLIGATSYVRNSWLRSQMAEVLHIWLPDNFIESGWRRARSAPQVASRLSTLYEHSEAVVSQLVPSLIRLYCDIESSGRHSQFYDKFNTRYQLGEILEYLWGIPRHREVLKALAAREVSGLYLSFCNFMVNDCIHLLDGAVTRLPEIRELEQEMEDQAAFAKLPQQERQEKTSRLMEAVKWVIFARDPFR